MTPKNEGFTLVELMMVVLVIGILVGIAVPRYSQLVNKSKEGATRGSLAVVRSALSIYYGDNEQTYPMDDLSSLTVDTKYLALIPPIKTPPHHGDNTGVTNEAVPTDTGLWSYNNDETTATWGSFVVGCLHTDQAGNLWSSY